VPELAASVGNEHLNEVEVFSESEGKRIPVNDSEAAVRCCSSQSSLLSSHSLIWPPRCLGPAKLPRYHVMIERAGMLVLIS
jgi:hypothetical protein